MSIFRFKHFDLKQSDSAMKVGTDAMLLGAFVELSTQQRGLDIGTGTGVLSLMLAQRCKTISIDAIEIDALAYKEAKHNFSQSQWGDRLNAIEQDFSRLEVKREYDLIISNPPYYQTRLESENERLANAKHERSLPLKDLIRNSARFLSKTGAIWLIVPFNDVEHWQSIASEYELHLTKRIDIKGKEHLEPKRSVLALEFIQSPLSEQLFIVRNSDNSYTEAYKELTLEYHLNSLN